MRLGMWTRLGLVVTGVGLVGWAVYWAPRLSQCINADEPWSCAYYGDVPLWRLGSIFQTWQIGVWGNLLNGVIAAALAWLLVGLSLVAFRWVAAGR